MSSGTNHLSFKITLLLLLSSATNTEQSKQIPAIYIFGDSFVDSGNNNYIPGIAKANFLPYGIDFGLSTGRCTNGKTVVDFLAIHLGLPYAPPYLGLPRNKVVTTGINYASAGSGILPDTNNKTLTLDDQIRNFEWTVKKMLGKRLRHRAMPEEQVSKSLFVVSTGVNDHFHNGTFRGSRKFASYLITQLNFRLKRLYSLGARKFLVNNVAPAGCFPSETVRSKPMGKCDEKMNRGISLYNAKLLRLLRDLRTTLPGLTFIHADLYKHLLEIRQNGHHYGITETWKPCCPNEITGDLVCRPNSPFCLNRNTHLFFDAHPTQIVNQIYATKCFTLQTICTPAICLRSL